MKIIFILVIILFIIFIAVSFSSEKVNFDTEFFERHEIPKINKIVNKPVRKVNIPSNISVNISMTTSPLRLKKIKSNLQFLIPLKIVDNIFINLPEKYRNEIQYDEKDIENILNYSSKIKIIILKDDIGPIAKILPAINFINENDIVISIDDDIVYSPALIHELVYHTLYYDGVFGGAGFTYAPNEYTGEHIDRTMWPLKYIPKHPQKDIIEGYGAIAYRKKNLNVKKLLELSQKSKSCKLSDDFVISYFLNKEGHKLYEINTEYYSGKDRTDLLPLSYGLGKDALHNGAGTNIDQGNVNLQKYKQCFNDLFI